MGNCFSAEENDEKKATDKQRSRKETVAQQDAVIMKLKIQKDRCFTRIKDLEKKEKAYMEQIKTLLQEKKKDQAKFKLSQKKLIVQQLESYRQKELFVEKQINNIEKAQDDVQFTNTLKASNQVLSDLQKEIDQEEIETARRLNDEAQMNREEMNELIKDDADDELDDELNEMEAALMRGEFDGADQKIKAGNNAQKQKAGGANKKQAMKS